MTLEEWIDFKTDYRYSGRLADFLKTEKERPMAWLKEYLNFGGYPRVILAKQRSEKLRIMDEIFRSYIEKDIGYLLGVERIEAFGQMIKILASQVGGLVNVAQLASMTGLSAPTLKQYLWYAEKTFIIKTIKPYFTNRQKEITKAPVTYF